MAAARCRAEGTAATVNASLSAAASDSNVGASVADISFSTWLTARIVCRAMSSIPSSPQAIEQRRTLDPASALAEVNGHHFHGERQPAEKTDDLAGSFALGFAGKPFLRLVTLDEPQAIFLGQFIDGQMAMPVGVDAHLPWIEAAWWR